MRIHTLATKALGIRGSKLNEATATYLQDSYRFEFVDEAVEVIVSRLDEGKTGLDSEVAIRSSIPAPGLLREARFNLSASRTRSEWAAYLTSRRPDVDWPALVEQFCVLSIRRYREGDPFVNLSDVEPETEDAFLLSPYIVDGPVASGIFAEGGAGKSLIALGMAVSVATGEDILGSVPSRLGPVLYLDWEWGPAAHAERLRAICAGSGIELPQGMLWYRREYASILESSVSIREFIATHGIVLVVVDSLGFARGGEPESADLTLRTFGVMNSYRTPVLYTDHIAKNAIDRTKSFGSVYTGNSSRKVWRLDPPKNDSTLGDSKLLGLVNTKANGKYHSARGLTLTTESDESDRLVTVTFTPSQAPLQSMGKSGIAPAAETLLMANGGGLTNQDIRTSLEAEGLAVSENVLGATLSAKRNNGKFVYRAGKWYLQGQEVTA